KLKRYAQLALLFRSSENRRDDFMLKKTSLIVATIFLLAAAGFFLLQKRSLLDQEIDQARKGLSQADLIEASPTILSRANIEGIKLFRNVRATRDLVRHGENYFAATAGGLVEYDGQGLIKREYTTLDGLPTNDLTALASYNGQL